MHSLTIDFLNIRRRQPIAGALLLLGGISITAYLAIQMYGTLSNLDEQETRFAIIQQSLHPAHHKKPLSAARAQKLRAEIKDANMVMLQLSLPWNDLFREIAASQKNQVALLSIVPDATRRSIKISGEAKNLKVLLAYVSELQKAKSLNSVYLQKHKVEIRSAQQPVQFTIIANWKLAQ